jgi:hypothetical protein
MRRRRLSRSGRFRRWKVRAHRARLRAFAPHVTPLAHSTHSSCPPPSSRERPRVRGGVGRHSGPWRGGRGAGGARWRNMGPQHACCGALCCIGDHLACVAHPTPSGCCPDARPALSVAGCLSLTTRAAAASGGGLAGTTSPRSPPSPPPTPLIVLPLCRPRRHRPRHRPAPAVGRVVGGGQRTQRRAPEGGVRGRGDGRPGDPSAVSARDVGQGGDGEGRQEVPPHPARLATSACPRPLAPRPLRVVWAAATRWATCRW